MSDALLTEISGKLTVIAGLLKGGAPAGATPPKAGPASSGGAVPDAAAKKVADAAAAKVVADKAAAAKVAADKKTADAAKAKAAAGPAAGTKGPGGKYTIEQVREKIREVASNSNLGKDSARDILDQDGGGVTRVLDLKPENYDKVYEACVVSLQSEGKGAAAPAEPEDDLM